MADEPALRGLAVTRDGRSVLAVRAAGNARQILAIPTSGHSPVRNLLPLTQGLEALDSTPDGGLYLDQFETTVELMSFPVAGGRAEKIAEFSSSLGQLDNRMGVLPDGRAMCRMILGGRPRLVAIDKDKGPVPLVNTTEDTAAPFTRVGSKEVAFLIGPAPRRTIATAAISNGRITRRIPFDKGTISALASSPDGNTLHCAANGTVWSIPLGGGDAKKVHAGDTIAVYPSGRTLVVQLTEADKQRFVRVSLTGGADQEIPVTGSLQPVYGIAPDALGKDNRLLTPVASLNAWDYPPAEVDLVTGRISVIPVDHPGDYSMMAWTPDGQRVLALVFALRSSIWRFTPERP